MDPKRFPTASSHEPPLISLSAPILLDRLAEEYVFAQICEAAMEAYAAENEARVQAMAAAKPTSTPNCRRYSSASTGSARTKSQPRS
jgi:F0F1-type ATP synthase gamma subunit